MILKTTLSVRVPWLLMVSLALGACGEDAVPTIVLDDPGPTMDAATRVPDATLSPPDAELPLDHLDPPSRSAGLDPVGVEAGDPTVLRLGAIEPINFERFVTSKGCALCHSNHPNATAMRDPENRELGPFNLWQGTMMANAARDPLWHAAVSAEVAASPSNAAAIEAKCIRCHAPMASVVMRAQGESPRMTDLFAEGTGRSIVGLDGVACALCHQTEKEGLGATATFSGEFRIGTERLIYGPHRDPAPGPMRNHVDYTPTYSKHVTNAAFCASCHTLFTHPIRADGTVDESVDFPEQTTFLEWEQSRYADENVTCQACHMPTVDEENVEIETRIARAPPGFDFLIDPRSPFGRHIFVGANTLIPQIIKRERAILTPQASDEAFDATIALARTYLQTKATTIELSSSTIADGRLQFGVRVLNRAGHKFPTGIPIRRAWLRVTVTDPEGTLLFLSGGVDAVGRLTDQRGEVLDIDKAGGPFEPHHQLITRHDEVQIYETVMHDLAGVVTHLLMSASGYLKDNRLLPPTLDPNGEEDPIIRPVGVDEDSDFVAGSDETRYEIRVGEATDVHVEVELMYQSVSARAIRELFQVDTAEIRAFRTMYERADRAPIASSTLAFDVTTQ